jgi:hypothetical protein
MLYRRHCGKLIFALFIMILAPLCSANGIEGGLSFSERVIFGSACRSSVFLALASPTLRPDLLAVKLTTDQRTLFDSIMSETYWTIGFLGANTASILIAVAIDPFVGSIVGILTLAGYAISSGYMAFGYRDLTAIATASNPYLPDMTIPWFASIGAASFAMGTITAIGLSYSDDTGTATVLAGVCGTISLVSGIVAVVTTFGYSNELGP